MTITEEQKKELEDLYQSLFNNDKVKRMLDIPMHRGSNCYIHSFVVAKLAIRKALKKKDVNLVALLYACVFHDYYLYDWRIDKSKRKGHGRNHPMIAINNAKEDFDLPVESIKAIQTHMWPLNFSQFPKTREAKILTLTDKKVALKEALISKEQKLRNRAKLLEYIQTLF